MQNKVIVPDTLDLRDHAELALRHLLRIGNEKRGYAPFFLTDLTSSPPKMEHNQYMYNATGRLVDAIILARQMCGDTSGEDTEEHYRRALVSYLSEKDGLLYRPESPYNTHHANMHDQATTLLGLTNWFLLTRDPKVKSYIHRLCEGLKKICIKNRPYQYWYYPMVEYYSNGWGTRELSFPTLQTIADPAWTNGRQAAMALVKYYEVTQDELAWELVENFINYTVHVSDAYRADGSFSFGPEFHNGHFHSRVGTLAGILRFALLTEDAKLIEWGRRCYEWAKTKGTSFGWFPEGLYRNEQACETCGITDMIDAAISLAKAGYTEYWSDVERFVRNHLVESQLRDTSWVKTKGKGKPDTEWVSYRGVASRALGAFAGWSLPNDFVSKIHHNWDIMTCCSCHGVRGLFLAWQSIVQKTPGKIYVNLLLNKDTPWVMVKSCLPYEGRVELIVKSAEELRVRKPDWVSETTLEIEVDGKKLQRMKYCWLEGVSMVGEYIRIVGLRENQVVKLLFPVVHREEKEVAWGQEYELDWRGYTVVAISPRGKTYPLYQREHMLEEKAPTREQTFYTPSKAIYW